MYYYDRYKKDCGQLQIFQVNRYDALDFKPNALADQFGHPKYH